MILRIEGDFFERRALLGISEAASPLENDLDYQALRREFAAQISLIADSTLRERLSELNYLLGDPSLESGVVSSSFYGRQTAAFARDLLSAHLRGDKPPATPENISL